MSPYLISLYNNRKEDFIKTLYQILRKIGQDSYIKQMFEDPYSTHFIPNRINEVVYSFLQDSRENYIKFLLGKIKSIEACFGNHPTKELEKIGRQILKFKKDRNKKIKLQQNILKKLHDQLESELPNSLTNFESDSSLDDDLPLDFSSVKSETSSLSHLFYDFKTFFSTFQKTYLKLLNDSKVFAIRAINQKERHFLHTENKLTDTIRSLPSAETFKKLTLSEETLSKENQKLVSKITELKNQIKFLQRKNQILEDSAHKSEIKISKLQSQLSLSQNQVNEYRDRCTELLSSSYNLQRQLDDANSAIVNQSELNLSLEDSQNTIQELKESLHLSSENSKELQKQLEKSQQQSKINQDNMDQIKDLMVTARKKLNELSKKLKQTQEKQKEEKNFRIKSEMTINTLTSQIQTSEVQNSSLHKQIEDIELENQKLRKDLENQKLINEQKAKEFEQIQIFIQKQTNDLNLLRNENKFLNEMKQNLFSNETSISSQIESFKSFKHVIESCLNLLKADNPFGIQSIVMIIKELFPNETVDNIINQLPLIINDHREVCKAIHLTTPNAGEFLERLSPLLDSMKINFSSDDYVEKIQSIIDDRTILNELMNQLNSTSTSDAQFKLKVLIKATSEMEKRENVLTSLLNISSPDDILQTVKNLQIAKIYSENNFTKNSFSPKRNSNFFSSLSDESLKSSGSRKNANLISSYETLLRPSVDGGCNESLSFDKIIQMKETQDEVHKIMAVNNDEEMLKTLQEMVDIQDHLLSIFSIADPSKIPSKVEESQTILKWIIKSLGMNSNCDPTLIINKIVQIQEQNNQYQKYHSNTFTQSITKK